MSDEFEANQNLSLLSFDELMNSGIDWDFIFICKSPVWSPPHLDVDFFGTVMEFEDAGIGVVFENGMSGIRYTDKFCEVVDSIRDMNVI